MASISGKEFRRLEHRVMLGKKIAGDASAVKKKKKKPDLLDVEGKMDEWTSQWIEFSWQGADVSLNEWYAASHWSNRDAVARKWHRFFASFFGKEKIFFSKYEIGLVYNSRLDPSNTITMIKLYEDTLKKHKIIPEDSKNECKLITLMPDLEMDHKQYKIFVRAV